MPSFQPTTSHSDSDVVLWVRKNKLAGVSRQSAGYGKNVMGMHLQHLISISWWERTCQQPSKQW